jgi:Alpha/beta hydrolase domain
LAPLAKDQAQREERGDSRPSVKELYTDRDAYLAKAKQAAQDLVREGFLLEEDIPRVLKRAEQAWDWMTKQNM